MNTNEPESVATISFLPHRASPSLSSQLGGSPMLLPKLGASLPNLNSALELAPIRTPIIRTAHCHYG